MGVRIGELLVKEKRISPDQLQDTLNHQKANGRKLGSNLVKLGLVKDEEITALLSKQYGVPSIHLEQFEIDSAVITLIPAETAQKYQIIPLSRAGTTLTIAMTDPTNVFAIDDIKFMTGCNVEPVVASETAVSDSITRYYSLNNASAGGGATAPAGPSALEMAAKSMEEMTLAGADDVEVLPVHGGDQRRVARKAGRRDAGHHAGERGADVSDSQGRKRHSHRACTRRSSASGTA